jgi:hypothetical protein
MFSVFMQQHEPAELFGSALLAKSHPFFALSANDGERFRLLGEDYDQTTLAAGLPEETCARNSVGDWPNTRLNVRLNCVSD